jgi:alkanesulfonate monooxygenase SsuD/methylene tetrahydromethanopterin reductase-like flavin-dependent oxidoreductase (luciferase family)
MQFFGDNRLKLGVFAANLDGGLTASTVEDRQRLSWDNSVDIARLADEGGFELQIPLARWKSLGGVTHFNGCNYEGLTWAAGLSAITRKSNIFATIHVPVIHPIVAAKQMTTIDHIGHGRFGLNLVCGWFPAEFEMFGAPMMGHDARYEYAAEWLEIVRKFWTIEDEFDYEGKFFKVTKGWQQPKPLRKPHPPIMNAGQSPTGARFAAKYADIAFQSVIEGDAFSTTRARFSELRRIAREDFSRELTIWTGCWVICRPTEKEAHDYLHYCLYEHGDLSALDGLPKEVLPPADKTPPDVLEQIRRKALGGWGGYHLVGTPGQIVDKLVEFSEAGADGVVLSWVNYQDGLRNWNREVMPLLEQAGLRKPARA